MVPLVSILVPAYNSERWLVQTLRSALDQTWARKEIIVVDDGSRDSTLEIAKSFEASSVKVVSQPNGGAPAARNTACALAQGDYIQWLDADDVLHPQKIERQMIGADDGSRSLTLQTCAWGRFFFRPHKAAFVRDALWRDMSGLDWIKTRFVDHVWMNPAVWLVSRRLTELAGPWDTRLGRSGDDDGEYVVRVAAASEWVRFVEDARCYYRIGSVGSLNWNRNLGSDTTALESLLLSLELATQALLKRQDDAETRRAAVSHLQGFAVHFYAAEPELLQRLDAMARSLGGSIVPPRAGWKYRPVETLLGPRVAKAAMRSWRSSKLRARRGIDWYLFRAGI